MCKNSSVEHNENNFLGNIETRAMIATLSADRSLVEVAGLRDEATEQGANCKGMALNALTSFARQSARVTARPAWTGKPRRRRIVSDCRPVAVRAPARARLAGTPGDRQAAGGGQAVRESTGNGAASLWKGSIRARKWRPAWPVDPQARGLLPSIRSGKADASRP